ncbi:DeoR/GlpR family DNA-binding transcription regulator [Neobacillus muris]|uniref:DeoR/GlpR family DNA-binding transcription regulator n=1 Tax=Neobacillus muris TaxID=2941334 RepID=UPI002040F41D|nr:DeoR/GlpR family DNA-binding transcription regulator [Neobacillus muris]
MLIERQKSILNLLNETSPLCIEELAAQLEVSEVTIRRDLVVLERQGLIIRERGKASLPSFGFEPLFNARQKQNLTEKRKIAKYVANQIHEGEVIALDVGTTTMEIAKELVKKSGITVFTSSLQVATILSKGNLEVYVLGGLIRKNEMSLTGTLAIETINKFNFDRFYVGIAGMEYNYGPTDFSLEEAEVKKAFIANSREVIAVVDHTKFTQTALVKICEFEQINEIITDKVENHPISPELLRKTKVTFVE